MMRLHFIALMTGFAFLASTNSFQVKKGLTITINNLHNDKGHVLVSVFNASAGFPDVPSKAVKTLQLEIVRGIAVSWLPDLPAGEYAIAILHDENNDQKMNTNWFGIPKEGYGFSNNVMGMFGPPSFDRAKFTIHAEQDVKVQIRARY
jgi:uncharacterized protein (DUF2141 family)